EPFTFAHLENGTRRRYRTVSRSVVSREIAGDVRVTDEANPFSLNLEAVLCLIDREHVFPDRISGAGVIQAGLMSPLARVKLGEKRTGPRVDRTHRPPRGRLGAAREVADVEVAAHDEVVIAGEADVCQVCGQSPAGVRRP